MVFGVQKVGFYNAKSRFLVKRCYTNSYAVLFFGCSICVIGVANAPYFVH